MKQNSPIACDYLFAGAGASAALLLMRMEREGLLVGKKVVLLDTDFTSLSRKTFCFWAKPDEDIARDCAGLIQKTWSHLRINRGNASALKPLQYHYIPGVNVQNAVRSLAGKNNFELVESSVNAIESHNDGVLVNTGMGSYLATRVFDSRPAGFLPPKPNESLLFQSFIGYMIEPEKSLSGLNCMDMMDFGVDQQGATQFVYVLPLSESKALVELTRFGTKKITEAEALPVLENYLQNHFGNARTLETETGCIPMCSADLEVHDIHGVVRLGGRAGAIKPGTGYAFKNMHAHAVEITAKLCQNQTPVLKPVSGRFRFYDRLLLWILSNHPGWGKPIFQQLFNRNATPKILHFLDEKTSLAGDLTILLSLPFKPFLQALWQDLKCRFGHFSVSRPLLLVMFVTLLCLVHAGFPDVYENLQWGLLAAGLFTVGIPHGAVDHLLGTGTLKNRPSPVFMLGYLGIMLLYLIVWSLVPLPALLLFIGYSAFHFGQSDLLEWNIKAPNPLKSFLWGLIALGIMLFTHTADVILIVQGFGIHIRFIHPQFGQLFAWLLGIVGIIWAGFEKSRAMFWSLAMLFLSMQLPVVSAFGLYFIGQHSINGWKHLKLGLQLDNKALYAKAFPFTLAAFILFGVFWWLSATEMLFLKKEQWISTGFVFIACLSLPHVWAMHKFYQK